MAIVTGNPLLNNLRGTIGGDVVFRRNGDKTVVSMKASPRKKNSPLQQLSVDRFKEAARYARAILRDPVKSAQYRKLAIKLKKHSAYNVAISEYMLRISIQPKDADATPVSKDKKRVTVTATKKNFKVKSVTVQIISGSGETVAEGNANPINSTDWAYKLSAPPEPGSMILVTATDMLGLVTTKYLWP